MYMGVVYMLYIYNVHSDYLSDNVVTYLVPDTLTTGQRLHGTSHTGYWVSITMGPM